MEDLPQWVNTFTGLSASCSTPAQLCDGILLTELMNQVAPEHFSYSVFRDGSDTAAHTNMTLLASGLEDFYRDEMEKHVSMEFCDLTSISRDHNIEELAKLMEAVVGAVVFGPAKERFIQPILGMTAASQQTVMLLAQRSQALMQPLDAEAHAASQQHSDEIVGIERERDDLSARLGKLEGSLRQREAEVSRTPTRTCMHAPSSICSRAAVWDPGPGKQVTDRNETIVELK